LTSSARHSDTFARRFSQTAPASANATRLPQVDALSKRIDAVATGGALGSMMRHAVNIIANRLAMHPVPVAVGLDVFTRL
jgi:hypothetical protein